jgi:Ca2+-binding EF-hand superfamily protein
MERKYRVKYDFASQDKEELSCKVGELVSSSTEPDGGWLKVNKSVKGGKNKVLEGLVPVSYLVEEKRPSAPQLDIPAGRRAPPAVPAVFQSVAIDHAECTICYDEMASRKCAVLLSANRKRACRHFLHEDCGKNLFDNNRRTCPICRAPFAFVSAVPSFDENPKLWFECVDADGNGALSKVEVLEVLKALFALDNKALEKNVDTLWTRWDKDGSGEVDFQELCDKKTGLLVYVRSHFARLKQAPPPRLGLSTREEWFQYFDEDGNGSLGKEEIVRALIKSFRLSSDLRKVEEIRNVLENVWMIFDSDGSGEIELSEFIQRDGLGETLIASLQGVA